MSRKPINKGKLIYRALLASGALAANAPFALALGSKPEIPAGLRLCDDRQVVDIDREALNPDMENFFKVTRAEGEDLPYRFTVHGRQVTVTRGEFDQCSTKNEKYIDAENHNMDMTSLAIIVVSVLDAVLISVPIFDNGACADFINKLLDGKRKNGQPLTIRDVMAKLGLDPKRADVIENLVAFAQNCRTIAETHFPHLEDADWKERRQQAIDATRELLAKVESHVGAIALKIYEGKSDVSFDDVMLVAFAMKAAKQTKNPSRVFAMLKEDEVHALLAETYRDLDPEVNVIDFVERLEPGTVSDSLLAVLAEIEMVDPSVEREGNASVEAIRRALLGSSSEQTVTANDDLQPAVQPPQPSVATR